MASKQERIANIIRTVSGRGFDPHYLGFFECFNRKQYYEAHEVLEVLWLEARARPVGAFYQGLIQLAGGFVHVQRGRLQPAAALFRLAERNLGRYGATYEGLEIGPVLELLRAWVKRIERGEVRGLEEHEVPSLKLLNRGAVPE